MSQPHEKPVYHLLGVPFRSGSLYPGSENDALAYRDAQVVQRLRCAGCEVVDDGDVAVPSFLPHHDVAPIKNWPGPRIVWDCIAARIAPFLRQAGHVPVLIGVDCSVVVGTTQALLHATGDGTGEEVHIIYLDGDIDAVEPSADRCTSAAAMGVWLLTHPSPFWAGPTLDPAHVTVMGSRDALVSAPTGLRLHPLADLRRLGPTECARQVLEGIPPSASILLHVDVDVLRRKEMPAAYFPHDEGLTVAECRELLAALLADPRIRIIEVAELAALRDPDQRYASLVVDMLASALSVRRTGAATG
jgi:arginase